MNYYRRYVGDYLKDTSRLSVTEHGAYGLLLDYYYSEERPLPKDREEIYTMIRAMRPADRAAVDKILERYFELREDGYHNGRADEELAKAAPIIEAARKNGRKGGRRPNPSGNPVGSGYDNPAGYPAGYNGGDPTGLEAGQHPPSSNHHTPTTSPQPPSSNHHKKTNGHGLAQAPFVLPEWIPADHWEAWIEARKKKRNAPTDYALRLAVTKLDNLREQGHPPAQVLMQSAFHGWSGLFPPKEIR